MTDSGVKVFCRFRPFNEAQIAHGDAHYVHRLNKNQLIIKDSKSEEISFMFDHVFDVGTTQAEVYAKMGQPILNNVLQGFNGTVMAYGQTSSGKTHTMQQYEVGDQSKRGLLPRMIDGLFTAIALAPSAIEFKIRVSIFQVYMEHIRDLLDPTKDDMRVRELKGAVYVQGLTEVYVADRSEIYQLMAVGQNNRSTGVTCMNQHSSRSHMIFVLSLNQFDTVQDTEKTSKLCLVDLAGSQKISKTHAVGQLLQEAKKINLSLTTLGMVIKALAERAPFIPFRDSKLTRILRDSLGGNSKTTLLVACSPHQIHLHQTISSLRFGENAQKIKNKPKINKELTVKELQKIVEKLNGQLDYRQQRVFQLQEYIVKVLGQQLPQKLQYRPPVKQKQQRQSSASQQNTKSVNQSVDLQDYSVDYSQIGNASFADSEDFQMEDSKVSSFNGSSNIILNVGSMKSQSNFSTPSKNNLISNRILDSLTEEKSMDQSLPSTSTMKKKVNVLENQVSLKKVLLEDDKIGENGQMVTNLNETCNPSLKVTREVQEISSETCNTQMSFTEVPQLLNQIKELSAATQCLSLQNEKLRVERKISLDRLSISQRNVNIFIQGQVGIEPIKPSIASNKTQQNSHIMKLETKLDQMYREFEKMAKIQLGWKNQCQQYEQGKKGGRRIFTTQQY